MVDGWRRSQPGCIRQAQPRDGLSRFFFRKAGVIPTTPFFALTALGRHIQAAAIVITVTVRGESRTCAVGRCR
jgi:hypothetical protein